MSASAYLIEVIAERLYEHDRGQAFWRRPSWRFATTRKQAEYRLRAEVVADLVERPK